MRFLPPKLESQALPWLRVSGLCPWTSAIPGPRDNTSTLGHHRLPDLTLKPTFPQIPVSVYSSSVLPGSQAKKTGDCAPLGPLAPTPH